jgi:DNA-binding protein YbaB
MGAVAGLMKNKEAVAQAVGRVRGELATRTVTVEGARGADGVAGICVVASGELEIVSVRVAPGLLAEAAGDEGARARLEGLLARACNAALARAKGVIAEEVSKESRALGLPEIPGLDGLLGGGGGGGGGGAGL